MTNFNQTGNAKKAELLHKLQEINAKLIRFLSIPDEQRSFEDKLEISHLQFRQNYVTIQVAPHDKFKIERERLQISWNMFDLAEELKFELNSDAGFFEFLEVTDVTDNIAQLKYRYEFISEPGYGYVTIFQDEKTGKFTKMYD